MPLTCYIMLPDAARIVCLTEETVETLYLLGEEHRIVGVSGYAVRPPRVRKEKPRVSAFISADIRKILALEPDLVLTFSDLQADIVAELIRAGVAGARLQPARHCRHLRDDPTRLGAGRRAGKAERAGALTRGNASDWRKRLGSTVRTQAACLFRGMGRADDFRHPLGFGTDRDRRRHRCFPGTLAAKKSATERIVTRRCGDRGRARYHSSAPGAARNSCRQRSRPVRASTLSRPCATAGCARSSRR